MEIEALKFTLDSEKAHPEKVSLRISGASDIEELKKERLPLVYVVKLSELSTFSTYEDLIEDRGIKHKSVPLWRIMREFDKIPVVDGGKYSSAGQFSRSINQLLRNAADNQDLNLYIVGVAEEIFKELARSAVKFSRASIDHVNAYSDVCSGSPKFPDTIMRLMTKLEVPKDLDKDFVGKSKEAEFVRQLILLAAETDDPVLIMGDTGTGKEIVAQQIHLNSKRKSCEIVPVNCAAIPHELFESVLFGHVKGAFTDAKDNKIGNWKKADNSTLFLDEVGEIPIELQAKILRALDTGYIRPVGSEDEIKVNARVIAATNRDVFSMIQSDTYREDLYYRLRGFYIPTPPLRDHPDDVPVLAQAFWNKMTHGKRPPLCNEIISELREYRWPGNARELKMVLTQLNSLFPLQKNLGVQHLNAIFEMQGQLWGRKTGTKTRIVKEQPCIKIECLRHLRRVCEIVRATQVAMEPITRDDKTDSKTVKDVSKTLSYRIEEIDMLCLYPLRFHDETTYVRVNSLRSKVFYFSNLLACGDIDSALSYWAKSLKEEFDLTLAEVLEEIEKINEEKNF